MKQIGDPPTKKERIKMDLFYLLQQSILFTDISSKFWTTYFLQLCEADIAGWFHILNLDIYDGGSAIVITLTTSALIRIGLRLD